jgi:hypothetical protein
MGMKTASTLKRAKTMNHKEVAKNEKDKEKARLRHWSNRLSIDPEWQWKKAFEIYMVLLSVYSTFSAAF